jgi:hypothetical protein
MQQCFPAVMQQPTPLVESDRGRAKQGIGFRRVAELADPVEILRPQFRRLY